MSRQQLFPTSMHPDVGASVALASRGPRLWTPDPEDSLDYLRFREDFLGGKSEIGNHCWAIDTVGTAGIFTYADQETSSSLVTAAHPGVIYIAAGFFNEVPVGDEACIVSQDAAGMLVGGGLYWECCFNMQGVGGSPGSVSYGTVRIGLGDSVTYADHTDGIYLEVDPNASANFRMVCASNGTRTKTSSSVAATGSTWYRGAFFVNSAATSVTFLLRVAGSNWQTLGTVGSNLPTGSGRQLGLNFQVRAVRVGSSALNINNILNVDAVRMIAPLVR